MSSFPAVTLFVILQRLFWSVPCCPLFSQQSVVALYLATSISHKFYLSKQTQFLIRRNHKEKEYNHNWKECLARGDKHFLQALRAASHTCRRGKAEGSLIHRHFEYKSLLCPPHCLANWKVEVSIFFDFSRTVLQLWIKNFHALYAAYNMYRTLLRDTLKNFIV